MADLPCYMGKVPDYEVLDGQMHIRIDGFRLVMPIHVFLAGCAAGKEAIKIWQRQPASGGEVLPFVQEYRGP
jgi:hypothetical protein